VFMVTDAEIGSYSGYTPISIDISDLVDGADHLVTFESEHPGSGLSNFFLDEVALVTCVQGSGSSTSGTSDTTAADTSTGTGSTDTGTGSSSSDTGSTGTDTGSSSSAT